MSESRYVIIPCEAEPSLAVIWDRLEGQVFDVIDALWDATPGGPA